MYCPDPQRWPGGNLRFPGGQPVSLDRQNISLLHEKRYWVTWKADGTRYMMLLCRWGVYLIDRAFNVRRVQVMLPRTSPSPHVMHATRVRMLLEENEPHNNICKENVWWYQMG